MSELLHYKNYTSSMHFSAEDEVFRGKVIGTTDLVNFEGSSVVELKKAFEEAIEDYKELEGSTQGQRKISTNFEAERRAKP